MFPLHPSLLPVVACAAACLSGLLAAWGAVCVRGSTAVPAALWAVAACLAFAGEMAARAAGGLGDPATAAAVRLGVVSLSLCPALSLLGAKRPQHGVWQLIVGTLAVVLVMPAASALLMRPGSLPDVHLLERCFMPLLVLVGWLNFAGTRRLAAVTGIAGAELLLMRGFLPGMAVDEASTGVAAAAVDAAAAGLLLGGTLLAAVQTLLSRARRATASSDTDLQRNSLAAIIDPPFLALRETLGAAWTLRIAERFDTVAVARGWPYRLRFGGLETVGGLSETRSEASFHSVWQRDALRAVQALLRRFVSTAWLARHGWPGGTVDGQLAEPLS